GRFTAVNGAGTALTGYSEQELLGRPALELIAPELRTEAVKRFERRLEAGAEALPDGSILVARDGRRVPVEVTSTIFIDAPGQLPGHHASRRSRGRPRFRPPDARRRDRHVPDGEAVLPQARARGLGPAQRLAGARERRKPALLRQPDPGHHRAKARARGAG